MRVRIRESITKKHITVTAVCAVVVLMFFLVYADARLNPTTPAIDASGLTEEMVAGKTYTQSFTCEQNGLSFVRIRFEIYDRFNSSTTTVRLMDAETPVQTWKIENKKLIGFYTHHALKLDEPVADSRGKNYVLEFTTNAEPGNGIGISEASYLNGGFCIDGAETGQTICYRLSYKLPLSSLFEGADGRHLIIVLALILVLCVGAPFIMNIKAEQGFMVAWVASGLLMFSASTLFNVPDEDFHFYRAYEIATGHLMTPVDTERGTAGRLLPFAEDFGVLEESWESFAAHSDMSVTPDLSYKNYFNTATYSPVSYLPQAIGMFFARLFTGKIAVIAYAGRILSWLVISFLLIMAVRIVPSGKEVMAMLLLMPMNIQESVSLSPDGLVMALAAFMVAYVMKLRHEQTTQLKLQELILLYVLAVAISLIKIVYLPFVLMYLLIPADRFGGKLKKTIHAIAIALAVIVLGGVWLLLCSRYLIHQGSDSALQLAYVLQHPLGFVTALFRTYFELGDVFVLQAAGASLAETNVACSGMIMLIYLTYVIVKIRPKLTIYSKSMPYQRAVLSVMTAGMFLLISMSLYLQWTYVYENTIQGLQGRYFLPLVLPVYYILNEGKPAEDQKLSPGAVGMIVLANACAGISLLFSCMS